MWAERTEHYLKPVFDLWWKLESTGHTEVLRGEEPAIIAPNHSCFLDPWLVSIVSPRPIRWLVTRKWYYKSWFWRSFFKAHGCLPVGDRAAETLETVCVELAEGKLIGIFPEGKISYDGKLQPFFSGIARMAAHSGAKVVPTGICGAHELLPRKQRLPKRGTVTIKLGAPRVFQGSPCDSPPPKPAMRNFMNELFRDVAHLTGQEERHEELHRETDDPTE